MDKFAELFELRELNKRVFEAELEKRRYNALLREFVERGRVLFGDPSLVYRQVYDKIYDFDVFETLKKESENV